MPRRYAITEDKRNALLRALRSGALYVDACASAGIPWSTWMDWCKRVREGTCDDPDVLALVTAAREAYGATNVGLGAAVAKAALKDWRAAAWLLEHRKGAAEAAARSRRAKHEATIAKHRADGSHVERLEHRHTSAMTDDELLAEAQRLTASAADTDDAGPTR